MKNSHRVESHCRGKRSCGTTSPLRTLSATQSPYQRAERHLPTAWAHLRRTASPQEQRQLTSAMTSMPCRKFHCLEKVTCFWRAAVLPPPHTIRWYLFVTPALSDSSWTLTCHPTTPQQHGTSQAVRNKKCLVEGEKSKLKRERLWIIF